MKDQYYKQMDTMEVNQLGYVQNVKKKSLLKIFVIEKRKMVKLEINHGVKSVDRLHDYISAK